MWRTSVLMMLLVGFATFQLGNCSICYCVTGSGVRIRSSPSSSGTILGLAYPGDCYWYDSVASGDAGGYIPLQYNGRTGWSSENYWEESYGC